MSRVIIDEQGNNVTGDEAVAINEAIAYDETSTEEHDIQSISSNEEDSLVRVSSK